jgi:hypothetical protein
MKTYNNTDNGNGFQGVLVNETLNREIERRVTEVEDMNKLSNWTKEMQERESILNKEIDDLLEARKAFEIVY